MLVCTFKRDSDVQKFSLLNSGGTLSGNVSPCQPLACANLGSRSRGWTRRSYVASALSLGIHLAPTSFTALTEDIMNL